MQAMFGWLGGFGVDGENTDDFHAKWILSGTLTYRYPVSKTADGTQQILYSPDMSSWTTRRISQRVVSEDADRMVIEATAPSGTKGFFKVVGGGDTSMVWVEGGILPQSSELAGTAVTTFQIGSTEVTWAQWQEVRDWAVGRGYGDLAAVGAGSAGNHPVHSVSWEDAVKWCNAKSEKEGLQPVYFMDGSVYRTGGTFWFGSNVSVDPSANGYRLPREAEWEWAASGGGTSQGHVYSGGGDLNAVGWYWDSSVGAAVDLGWGRGTWPVAQRTANELGLYDMSGNLAEWCWDATANYDTWRRLRGGSWEAPQDECGVFARSGRYASHGYYPAERINRAGFRLARNAD
jgi:formylglycine-generating enzyme required for sulfatase activity